jgi:xanthine/uracil permease
VQGDPAALDALREGLVGLGLPIGVSEALKVLMESGMAMGTLAAACLNLILPQNDEEKEIDTHE